MSANAAATSATVSDGVAQRGPAHADLALEQLAREERDAGRDLLGR